jgi:hypothetical protein
MKASSMRGSITRIPLQAIPWLASACFNLFLAAFNLINEEVQHGAVCLHFQDSRHAGHQLTRRFKLCRLELNQVTGNHLFNPGRRILGN